eukprot:scaffold90658_cov116-Cyclotella_meneghiniana.AAC.6
MSKDTSEREGRHCFCCGCVMYFSTPFLIVCITMSQPQNWRRYPDSPTAWFVSLQNTREVLVREASTKDKVILSTNN